MLLWDFIEPQSSVLFSLCCSGLQPTWSLHTACAKQDQIKLQTSSPAQPPLALQFTKILRGVRA